MEIRDAKARDGVVKALADAYSRAILTATVSSPKSAVELSRENGIPISSAYRRIHELMEVGLLSVERSVITGEGKRYDLYRSTVKGIMIRLGAGGIDVELAPNEDMVAKFARLWSSVRGR